MYQQQNRRPHQSRPSSHVNGAKVRLQPSFRLSIVGANVVVRTDEAGDTKKEVEFSVIKSIPLMKGVDRNTAKRSCDMMQEEYDRECRPMRVYLFTGTEEYPNYAGLAGATK